MQEKMPSKLLIDSQKEFDHIHKDKLLANLGKIQIFAVLGWVEELLQFCIVNGNYSRAIPGFSDDNENKVCKVVK